ncbi:MAG TPA: TlpA disulfide reductase family protein [Bryobacteraceae bacterium]|nr:TlpA disulfide reductase family protein [Bryobacteraceae bacterium]
MTTRRLGILFGAGLLLIGLASACGSKPKPSAERPEPVKSQQERKPAPDFSLKDGDGRTVRLSDYRGKVVLLNFWATWCGPCKIEVPWFIDFERRNKDRGFSVIGVSMDDDGWEAVKPFVNRLGVNYRIVLGDDRVSEAYGGVEALPTTFLIDREGNIAAVHVGLAGKNDFEDGIEKLLEGSSGGSDRAGAGTRPAGSE